MHDFILGVKAIAGDTHPVGEDFLYQIVDFCTQGFILVVMVTNVTCILAARILSALSSTLA